MISLRFDLIKSAMQKMISDTNTRIDYETLYFSIHNAMF